MVVARASRHIEKNIVETRSERVQSAGRCRVSLWRGMVIYPSGERRAANALLDTLCTRIYATGR